MIDRLLSHVAPHSCCGCAEVGSEMCEGCKHNIIADGFSVCIGCLRPTYGDNLCSTCNEFSFEAAWCVGWRRAGLKLLLDEYKFRAVRSAHLPLAELLDLTLPYLPAGTVVTVVPTASPHVRERGFDHMRLIAREFARRRGLSFMPLLRSTSGGTQHFRSRHERLAAVKKAFEVVSAEVPTSILLLDDILTTGATLQTCSHLLKEAGAETLYGAIIARQPLDEKADL